MKEYIYIHADEEDFPDFPYHVMQITKGISAAEFICACENEDQAERIVKAMGATK